MSSNIETVSLTDLNFGVLPSGQEIAKGLVTVYFDSVGGRLYGDEVGVAVSTEIAPDDTVARIEQKIISAAFQRLQNIIGLSIIGVSSLHSEWKKDSVLMGAPSED